MDNDPARAIIGGPIYSGGLTSTVKLAVTGLSPTLISCEMPGVSRGS